MPGTKTSVWLGEEQYEQWKASGESLTEIVKRGLAAPPPERPVTSAEFREEIATLREEIPRVIRAELERIAGRQ